jgi:cytochrome P450/ferredoxin-NADP reductase
LPHRSQPVRQAHRPERPTGCPISHGAASFDPFADGYQQDPPEYVRWAREQEPVFYSPQLGYWVVTRFDDIKAIFRDNLTFSPSIALEKITPTGDEANAVLASYGFALNRTLVNEDEPAHMPRRRALMQPFTPEELKHHEPMVRRLAREYVDRFIDDGRADLVDQMLWEVPLTVAMHFLGVPADDMDTLRQYSIAHTVNTWGRPGPKSRWPWPMPWATSGSTRAGFSTRCAPIPTPKAGCNTASASKGAARGRHRLLSALHDDGRHGRRARDHGQRHGQCGQAAAAAPQVWQEICADPSLIPNAVEECLRHNGSVAAWRRLATKDVVIGGQAIPAGSKLLIVTSSANHDEQHFVDADLFDIHRDNASDHLTFGYGSHQCMGKNLARMEMQIFLEEFTRRLPHMQLAEQRFTYVPNTSFRGPEHLWVQWDVSRNPERANPAVLAEQQPVRIGESSQGGVSRSMLVDSTELIAQDVLRVRLKAPDGRELPRWTPGSHIDLHCGDTGISRQYSLCGDPQQADTYEIAVLREEHSRGGSAWIHGALQAGMKVQMRGPRNHFKLDESAQQLILVAGGIGITPVAAMAARAQALGIPYEIHYSCSQRERMALLDALQARHGERLQIYVGAEGRRADYAALLAQVRPGAQIYACGPQRMLDGLAQASQHWPEDSLRVEHFSSTLGALDPDKEHGFEVELRESGITLQVRNDETLLDALRSANIDIECDCREGLCGSCEVPVLEGDIDHRDMVLTRAERTACTKMMSCCSRARTQESRIVLAL